MRLLRLFLLPILLLLLAACGTTATPAAPTSVPITATTGSLPESAAAQDMLGGELSVSYPAGWTAKTEGEAIRILLATSADLLENTNATLTAGQVQAVVSATPIELAGAGLPSGTTLSPKTFLAAFATTVGTTSEAGAATPPGAAVQSGTVTETTVNGNPAARMTITASGSEALVLVFASSEAYVLFIGTAAKGDLANQEARLMEIAASADYVKAAE